MRTGLAVSGGGVERRIGDTNPRLATPGAVLASTPSWTETSPPALT